VIILDEYAYCEHLIKDKLEKITQNDLNFVAKYWDGQEFSEAKIKEKLKAWCLEKDPDFNLIINRYKIRKALIHARNYRLRKEVTITITQSEIESIQKVQDYGQQKILFCMLVVAKFYKFNSNRKKPYTIPSKFGVFFNGSIREIFKMAGVCISRKEWIEIKHQLYLQGLLTSGNQRSGNNFRMNFYNDDSSKDNNNPIIAVIDFRNIVAYYQQYCGEEIIECEGCHKLILQKRKNHKVCSECWKERDLNNHRNRNRKYYNLNRTLVLELTCDNAGLR
jgi:hypothetical protein